MPSVRIAVHVTPRAARDEMAGWRGNELSVRVTAAPADGAANAAVERVVASALGLPKSAVAVVRGHTSRNKQLKVEGVAEAEVWQVFGGPGG